MFVAFRVVALSSRSRQTLIHSAFFVFSHFTEIIHPPLARSIIVPQPAHKRILIRFRYFCVLLVGCFLTEKTTIETKETNNFGRAEENNFG